MLTLCIIFLVLSGLVTLVWASRHIQINREHRSGFTLTPDYPGPPADAPMISVIVAAKDEAENIETCIRTMLDQDYPNFEILVCNDRSTDGTDRIVEGIAAEDNRVRLINITNLPDGWCGKNNAMQTGIAQTKGEWICMIDADCRQTSNRTLSTAMQYATDKQADFLSVLPTLEMKGFWENVVQPVCGGVMVIWFKPDNVNNPNKPQAYANGAFMMLKRSTYEAIGTHEAVKDRVNEDMHMAAKAKAAGQKLRIVRSKDLYLVRMYTSLKQIVRGWGRIFFGTFGTLPRLIASLALLVIMGIVPYIATALGFALAGISGMALVTGLVGVAAVTMQISVAYRFYKLTSGRPGLAWTYAIGCSVAIVAVCIALSKLHPNAKVSWRGTHYSAPTGN